MTLRWLALGMLLLETDSVARAQVGIYGKFNYTRYSVSNSDALNYAGGGVGVYDDFVHLGPLSLGLEICVGICRVRASPTTGRCWVGYELRSGCLW